MPLTCSGAPSDRDSCDCAGAAVNNATMARQTTSTPVRAEERCGGGGGIRTRVRKYILARIYDAYLLLKSRPRREEAAKNRQEPAPVGLAADVRNNASAASLLK